MATLSSIFASKNINVGTGTGTGTGGTGPAGPSGPPGPPGLPVLPVQQEPEGVAVVAQPRLQVVVLASSSALWQMQRQLIYRQLRRVGQVGSRL
jgi:hypothetical protein